MEQKDYFMRHVEQLSSVLKKIISDFMDLDNPVVGELKLLQVSESLDKELDIDLEKILQLNPKETIAYFKEKSFHHSHIELLSDLLLEMGKVQKDNDELGAQELMKKAAELLEIANQVSHTISFSRITKKAKLESELENKAQERDSR